MTKPWMSAAKPDSGWSWVIAVSCCLLYMISPGVRRLSGLFLVETRKVFTVSRKEAALPYSMAIAMRNFTSPLAGIVAERIGVRRTILLGLLIAGISVAACSVAKDVAWIIVFFGLIYGIANGFGSTLLPLPINQYFDKYRSTASGIVYCGAGLGNFLLSPLLTALLAEYGLNGTFLFISAFIFQTMPLVFLLKTPAYAINQKHVKHNTSPTISIKQKENSCQVNVLSYTNTINYHLKNNEERETCFQRDISGHLQQKSTSTHCSKSHNDSKIGTMKLNSKGIDSNPANPRSNDNTIIKKCFRLCKSPTFLLILFSKGIFGYTSICLLTCIVDYMKDIGIDEKNKQYVLMIFSIGDVMGTLGLGLIPDLGYMTKSNYTAFLFGIQGLLLAACVWSTSFTAISMVLIVYGIFQGGVLSICPVLIGLYVEPDLQVIAVPSSNFLIAPVALFVPPVIGLFREKLGSYVWIFYHISILSTVIAILWLCVTLKERRRKKGSN